MTGEERRMDARGELNELARFKVLSGNEEKEENDGFSEVKIKNVSRRGACLESDVRLDAGSIMKLEFQFNGRAKAGQKPIRTFCEVQWCRGNATGKYETGLNFIVIKEDDVNSLNSYVKGQERAF